MNDKNKPDLSQDDNKNNSNNEIEQASDANKTAEGNKVTKPSRISKLFSFLSTPKQHKEYDEESTEYKIAEIRSKYKTYLIIAIICIITINIIFTFGITLYMQNISKNAADKAYDMLHKNLDNILTDDIKQRITNEVLKEHMREYYLPEDYFSMGIYVRDRAKDVAVEIISGWGHDNIAKKGTGLIINSNGYIITNTHVITHITEEMAGGYDTPIKQTIYTVYDYIGVKIANEIGVFRAEKIAYDKDRDIAIIKLLDTPENQLSSVVFTLSDYVSMGEEVAIIGNTLGFGITVSLGSILGTNKYAVSEEIEADMLQLDALTLEGNSGAGVFNPLCELVGMVSFKMISLSDSNSVCYALSSVEIIDYLQDISTKLELDIPFTLSNNIP